MSKAHSIIVKTETLTLSLAPNEKGDNRGYWLYDKTRGMNLSMRADTEQAAFIEALEYYQERLQSVESTYKVLQSKVDSFVSQFIEESEGSY